MKFKMSNTNQILEDYKNGKITSEQAEEQIKKCNKQVTCKVSPKGAISFYGTRRLPITLYKNELDQILTFIKSSEFQNFLDQNKDKLSKKTNTTE